MRKFLKSLSLILIILLFGAILVGVSSRIYLQASSKEQESPLKLLPTDTKNLHESRETPFLEKIGLLPEEVRTSGFEGYHLPSKIEESPVAVIVENHSVSRPQQSGLSIASIVYETLAEGGITRFLAIFPYQKTDRIGPVRSLRPYFLDWAQEHAHTVVHAGGSDEALQSLYFSNLIDIDEDDLDTKKLYRDDRYDKPHNLFADLTYIREIIKNPSHTWEEMPFIFQNDPLQGKTATELTFDFSSASYKTSFIYDEQKRRYTRFQNGSRSKDMHNDKPLTPSNIIVQVTNMEVIDDIGRLDIRTEGSGKSLFFSQGKMQEGTWKKQKNSTKSTQFFAEDGKPFPSHPGQTWIIIIDSEDKIQYE